MLQHPFAIEFCFPSEKDNKDEPKYQAVITTLSNSLKLFKVSEIRKISGEAIKEPEACYHLTSYPLNEEKEETWKDAVTRTSDQFVQAIGAAIEKYIYTTQQIAPYLN